MSAPDFSFVTCLATNGARQVLVEIKNSWFVLTYNLKLSALQYLPLKAGDASNVSRLDVYSPANKKMMATDICIKHKSPNTIQLFRDSSPPHFKRWPQSRSDLMNFKFLGVYIRSTLQDSKHCVYRHEAAELKDWSLQVTDYNLLALRLDKQRFGTQVPDANTPRRVHVTASSTELVTLFKGRSEQFLARAVLASLRQRHKLVTVPVYRQPGMLCKSVAFVSAACTEVAAENAGKSKCPQLRDRNMRKDIADPPTWHALDFDRDTALAFLNTQNSGAFVVFGVKYNSAMTKACTLAVKVSNTHVQEKRIVMMQARRNRTVYAFSDDLLAALDTEWQTSLNSLLEPLYKLTQQKLKIPLRRMDFESY